MVDRQDKDQTLPGGRLSPVKRVPPGQDLFATGLAVVEKVGQALEEQEQRELQRKEIE